MDGKSTSETDEPVRRPRQKIDRRYMMKNNILKNYQLERKELIMYGLIITNFVSL